MDLGELWGSLNLDDGPFADGLKSALASLTDFSGKGVAIAGAAGVAVALAFGASVVKNMQLDAAQDRVAAQLGLTETESAKAGRVAGKAYADNYGESLEQVNQAVGTVMGSIKGMRDASEKELQAVTQAALTFSDVMEVDIDRAAQVAGQAVSQGLAKDATEAFDLLTAASQKVPPALREDLLDAVDEYGPMFAALGMSGEEAFGMLVDASAKGMYGIDKTGDALKEFTIRATDMSQSTAAALGSIDGIDVAGLDKNSKEGKAIMDRLGADSQELANDLLAGGDRAAAAFDTTLEGLLSIKDPAARASAAIALFGTPIEDLSTNEIPKFLESLRSGSESMAGFEGATARASDTLSGNSLATLEKWKRGAQMAFMGLADWAIPAINDTVTAIDKMLSPIGGASGGVKYLAMAVGVLLVPALIAWGVQSTIAGVKAAAAWTMAQWASIRAVAAHVAGTAYIIAGWIAMGAAAAAQAIRMAAAWVLGVVTGAATSVASMAVSVATVVAGWLLMAAQSMAAAVRMAASWLIAMGPIGWVIIAVAALVALIVAKWDWIKAKTVAIWGALMNFVRRVPGMIASFFSNWSLPGLIMKHWDMIKSTFSNGISAVINLTKSLGGKIKAAFAGAGSWLLNVGESIMDGLGRGIERGLDWVKGKLSGIGRAIPGWLQKVLGINSPSKVMRDEVGQWIPAGVADGIVGGTPLVESAMRAMASAATASITGTASVGVVGSVAGGTPVTAGPFAGVGGPGWDGKVHLDDATLRSLAAMILDGSEHVAGKTLSHRELQDRLGAAMPNPNASGGIS